MSVAREPHRPARRRSSVRQRERAQKTMTPQAIEVPRLRAKDYMDSFINPAEYLEAQRKKLTRPSASKQRQFPARPERDVLQFLLEHAPLERWERDVLEIIREEAYYFVAPDADEDHERGLGLATGTQPMMTERCSMPSEIIDYADNNAGVIEHRGGNGSTPTSSASSSTATSRSAGTRASSAREWEECQRRRARSKTGTCRLGLGREKIFEVRKLYNDVTFIDEFLTPEFAIEQKLFTFAWSNRNDRWEIDSREFKQVKEKLLFQLTNFGNPFIYVVDANFDNRGELLLSTSTGGRSARRLRGAVSEGAGQALEATRLSLTKVENAGVILRFDGKEQFSRQTESSAEATAP